uniref:Daxx histone-binding domain-containing protein n=1 Tax=Trichobilharzia regenti TaxID=157069 RepID=A0AA85JP30_TRIRE|nr:unnamed protein product [Trichobilharzia regenti]
MGSNWDDFEKTLRKYLSNSDEQIAEILKRKFFQTSCEFQRSETCKTLLDKCITGIVSNPDRLYVLLNDLKTTLRLHVQKVDKKHHLGGITTKRRLDIKTLSHETSHTKSQDSLNNGVDQTSSKPSSLASDDDDDDDVIIVDSPDTQGSGVVQSASNVDDSQQNPATSSAAAEEEEKLKSTDESDTHSTDIQSERRQKLIARLEVLLVRLSQAIRELEEKELDLDELDSSDSPYLKLDTLKRQYLKAWRRLCEIRNVARISGRILRQRFTYNGCQYSKVNEMIEDLVNKKKLFPDCTDIYRIVATVNKKENLNLTGSTVKSMAREIFLDVGHLLKQRRQDDLRHDFGCHLTDDLCEDDDPTYSDRDLRRRLNENKRLGDNNLNKVFKHFIDLQHTSQSAQPTTSQDSDDKPETMNTVDQQINTTDPISVASTSQQETCPLEKTTNDAKDHIAENSSDTSDEVLTLSSDSEEEEEEDKDDNKDDGDVKKSHNSSGLVNPPSSSSSSCTTSSVPVCDTNISSTNNESQLSPPTLDHPIDSIDRRNSIVDSSTVDSPTTINLVDDDTSCSSSPTSSYSISEPPKKLPKSQGSFPVHTSPFMSNNNSNSNNSSNNNRFTFSTPIAQETRQSSQILTVATRFGPHGFETMRHMASAHIVHRYPVTATLLTSRTSSSQHFTNGRAYNYQTSVVVTRDNFHSPPRFTHATPFSSNYRHPTVVKSSSLSNSVSRTQQIASVNLPTSSTPTPIPNPTPAIYENETIEID